MFHLISIICSHYQKNNFWKRARSFQGTSFDMFWSSYGAPQENGGAGAPRKNKKSSKSEIKWGQTPAFYFVGCILFFEGPNPST